jgi:glycosyltransferase involved in cell wall biosynthesis
MAAGIPSVISPVGANNQVLENSVTGFFASSTQEWVDKLSALIEDASLRRSMGKEARRLALTHYDRPVVFRQIRQFLVDLTAVSPRWAGDR